MVKHLLTLFFSIIFLNGFSQVPVLSPINGASVVCTSSAISLSYSTSATNSPLYYTWTYISSTSSATLSSNSNVGTAVFYDINQTYTLYCTATNSSGTSTTETLVVKVFETPNVSFSGVNTFCQGSSTNLSASSTIQGASTTVSYNWSPSIGLNTTTGSSVTANPLNQTTYTVTATNGACSNSSQITVTPFEMLPVTFSGANTFCQGSSTNLSASSTIQGGSSTVFYSWFPGFGLNTTTGPNVIANPSVSTTYTVTGYYGTCSNTGTITVTPNNFTPPIISASASNTLVCYGDFTTLNAIGANTYTWTNNVQNGIPFQVYNTNTYYVSGTDINGCIGSSSVTVNVNQLALFSVGTSDYGLQAGQTATLTIYGSTPGTTYYINGVAMSTSVAVSPTVTTSYTFTSVNSSGCVYTYYYTQYVGLTVGVHSANVKDEYFIAYPNPNNGVFNLKSSVKETIRVINELGEIIRVVELSPETEYQVSDLSSGIYMIQSDRTRMKIIVSQ